MSGVPSRVWNCKECDGWHFDFDSKRPSYPKSFKPRTPRRGAIQQAEPDLPEQARPVKKTVDKPSVKAQGLVKRRDGELF